MIEALVKARSAAALGAALAMPVRALGRGLGKTKGRTRGRAVRDNARRSTFLLGTAGALLLAASGGAADDITIGTGGVAGVYYPAGGAICRLVNRARDEHGLRCEVETTGGSVENLEALRDGSLDFSVAQSDWHYYAYEGTADFDGTARFDDMRSVFAVHPESFTVVTRASAGVTGLRDLEGRRVNVGNPGSGQRATMEVLMAAMGWGMESFAAASELEAAEQSRALCDNAIDAMIYIVGHPSGAIEDATTGCDGRLLEVVEEPIFDLIEERPYYRSVTIPGGSYDGNPDDVLTFGVTATLVTRADVAEETVYALVRAVFDNFDQFRSLHPAFANLDPREMARDGLSAPLHPGAARYFREAGLIE
ncbi:MAG: TAXI family TRAP transporter solute-binding subunit [Pseudomonadota bacterium]